MEPSPPLHATPSITITGDLICIGNKRFHLKCGTTQVTDAESLERVKSLIEKHFDVQAISSAMQDVSQASVTQVPRHAPAPFRIRLTAEGAQVSRVEVSGSEGTSSQVVSCKGQVTLTQKHLASAALVQQNYQSRLEKIQREFTEVNDIAQKLTSELVAKGYSPDEVRQAITMIFEEGHHFMSGEMPEWGEKTVADLLHEQGNEALFQALKKVKETYSYSPETTRSFFGKRTYRKKCAKDMQIFILKNQKRNIRSVAHENKTATRQHFVTWKKSVQTLIQNAVIIKPANFLQTKQGLPSEADKGEYRSEIEDFNTNLGVVGHITAEGSLDHVIATRSGKSDTLSRLQEHVVTSLLHELASTHSRGIEQLEDGTHTYQATITSYLDPSTLKAMPERMQAFWKRPEDEQEYLFSIIRAADEWPPEGYKVTVEKADGTQVTVVLKKPIILNQLFSTTVRGVATQSKRYGDMGQKRSDAINVVPNQLLVQRYLKKHPLTNSAEFKEKNKALNDELMKALGGATYLDAQGVIDWEKVPQSKLVKHKDFFTSDAFQDYQMFLAQSLVNRIKTSTNPMQEKALFVTLFRQFPPLQIDDTFTLFPAQDKEMHAADFAIYKNILFRELGIPCAFQCKSGTDRTGLGVALACAQDAYRREYHKDFDPQYYDTDENLHFFKEEFRKALKELGIAITVETKGYFGIKWGGGVPLMGGKGNPVAYKYLYLEGDDPGKTDVVGLNAQDLQARGVNQYKGTLTDPEGVYKKSSKTYVKALEERKKAHSPQEVRDAIDHVSDFFHTIIEEKPNENLFNEKMQLDVHVRRLHLNRKARNNNEKTRFELLDAEIEKYERNTGRTSKQDLELYMLRHVKMLWEVRQESKDLHVAQTFAKTMQFSPPATTTLSLDEEVTA